MQEQVDGHRPFRKVIVESGTDLRPRVSIKDAKGKAARCRGRYGGRHCCPSGPISWPRGRGQRRRHHREDPRETTKTKDITGGLPVAELSKPANRRFAVISEIDGIVSERT